jgi:hypothetical protein
VSDLDLRDVAIALLGSFRVKKILPESMLCAACSSVCLRNKDADRVVAGVRHD